MNSRGICPYALAFKRGLPFLLILVLCTGTGEWDCYARPKSKVRVNQEQRNAAFQQLFETVFRRWDSNHDGKLDLGEIDAAISNPQIHGNDSAIAVMLRRRLQSDDNNDTTSLALDQVLDLAKDPKIQRIVARRARHIQAINHSLFLSGDPNLTTFHQGRMGDCYFLAVVGAYVFYHPDSVRNMIRPLADGRFEVQFGDGQVVSVAPMTDAELLMGATEGSNRGIWLSVLEKAYAQIKAEAKEERIGKRADADDAIISDVIGHGGYYNPVIKLFTGHQPASPPLGRWLKQGQQTAVANLARLFTKLTAAHRLMAVGTRKDKALPKGIPHGHVFAVLGYNPSAGMVLMFNPWGNHLTPNGQPGLVNGYPTEHGLFYVPIGDFVRIFSRLSYETDKPAKR